MPSADRALSVYQVHGHVSAVDARELLVGCKDNRSLERKRDQARYCRNAKGDHVRVRGCLNRLPRSEVDENVAGEEDEKQREDGPSVPAHESVRSSQCVTPGDGSVRIGRPGQRPARQQEQSRDYEKDETDHESCADDDAQEDDGERAVTCPPDCLDCGGATVGAAGRDEGDPSADGYNSVAAASERPKLAPQPRSTSRIPETISVGSRKTREAPTIGCHRRANALTPPRTASPIVERRAV
jgi:hypothetical protein